jgi:hypothetical protein
MMHEMWRAGLAGGYAPTAADAWILARETEEARARMEIAAAVTRPATE